MEEHLRHGNFFVDESKQVVLQCHWHAHYCVRNLITNKNVIVVSSLGIARKKKYNIRAAWRLLNCMKNVSMQVRKQWDKTELCMFVIHLFYVPYAS